MTKRKSKRSFVRESTSKPSSTRKHVICDCNICQGVEVDPRTKESHMKKREISRVFTDRTPERPSEIGTSRSHIILPMILSFLWKWTKWKSAMIPKMNNMIPEINKNLIFLQRKRVNPKENLILIHLF